MSQLSFPQAYSRMMYKFEDYFEGLSVRQRRVSIVASVATFALTLTYTIANSYFSKTYQAVDLNGDRGLPMFSSQGIQIFLTSTVTALNSVAALWISKSSMQFINDFKMKRKLRDCLSAWCDELKKEGVFVGMKAEIPRRIEATHRILDFVNPKRTKNNGETMLDLLDLSNLRISSLPEEIFDLIDRMTNRLTKVNLSGNYLNTLPLRLPKNLITLEITNNVFENFPEQIRSLKRLEKLDVSMNFLKSLPEWLIELEHLTTIYCPCNRFESLPNMLPLSLREFDFRVNKITTIPSSYLTHPGFSGFRDFGNRIRQPTPPLFYVPSSRTDINYTSMAFQIEDLFTDIELLLKKLRANGREVIIPIHAVRVGEPLTHDLEEELMHWEVSAARFQEREPRDSKYFSSLIEHPDAQKLIPFFEKVRWMREYQPSAAPGADLSPRNNLISQLMEIMTGAVEHVQFREKFFEIISETQNMCATHAGIKFSELYAYFQAYCRCQDVRDIAIVVIGLRRMEIVEMEAVKFAENKGLEVIPFTSHCLLQLREPLSLPIPMPKQPLQELSPHETQMYNNAEQIPIIEEALTTIKQAAECGTEDRFSVLMQSEIWKDRIRSKYAKEFEKINEEFDESDTKELDRQREAGAINSQQYLEGMKQIEKKISEAMQCLFETKTREFLATAPSID